MFQSGVPCPAALKVAANRIAESLLATLFPSDCRVCGVPLRNVSRLPVCLECLLEIPRLTGPMCAVCGERLPELLIGQAHRVQESDERLGEDAFALRCSLCRRGDPPYTRALAYGSYDGGLRELVHLLKYERVRPAAKVLGRMVADVIATLEPSFGAETVLLIPVPLHSSKFRQRQFNQSELIARAALKSRSLNHRIQFSNGVLNRRRSTTSQIGLSSHQRRENLRGAFDVQHPDRVKGRQILLVDDVFTTGTTVAECAKVLVRAGASKVWVVTAGRTQKYEMKRILQPFADQTLPTRLAAKMAAAG